MKPTLPFLTYLAQVRQQPFKNAWLYPLHALTLRRILHIKPSKRRGTSRKEIVIIGTAHAAVLAGQNRNMDEWLKGAGYWHLQVNCFSSPSLAKGRK